MIPYGIVYSDNILSVNESRKQWIKRAKLINTGSFIKGYVLIIAILVIANLCIIGLEKNPDFEYYSFLFPMEAVLSFFLLYITVRKNKENAYTQNCYSQEKKQAVLRENSAIFTAPYRKSEYYYDEIEQVIETENTITLFVDMKYTYPIFISKNNVEKGDITLFRDILREKTGNRYILIGGAVK